MASAPRHGDRLRVVLTVHHRLLADAGASGATLALAEELERRGHGVEVVGLDLLHRPRGSTLDAIRFPRAAARMVRRRLDRGDVDVLDASSGDLAWLDVRRVRASALAVLTRSHGLEPLAVAARREGAVNGELELRRRFALYHGGFRLREVARSLTVADAVLVLNDAEEHYVTSALGIAPARVWRTAPLVRRGFSPSARDESRDLLVLGPDSWRKGGDVARRVLDAVLRSLRGATATWAGLDAPEATGAALGGDVAERVALRGRYGTEELAGLLGSHRVLICASRFEGLPVTLLEAAASGIATVGSDVPGVADVLGSGAGVLVPKGHVEGFVAATISLLEDDAARARCATAAQAVATTYSSDAVVDRLVATYRSVLAAKRPAT